MKTRQYPTNMGANLDVLCHRLNELTSPGELRTDAEHVWCDAEARAIRATIQQRFPPMHRYEVAESGQYIPTRFYYDERRAETDRLIAESRQAQGGAR